MHAEFKSATWRFILSVKCCSCSSHLPYSKTLHLNVRFLLSDLAVELRCIRVYVQNKQKNKPKIKSHYLFVPQARYVGWRFPCQHQLFLLFILNSSSSAAAAGAELPEETRKQSQHEQDVQTPLYECEKVRTPPPCDGGERSVMSTTQGCSYPSFFHFLFNADYSEWFKGLAEVCCRLFPGLLFSLFRENLSPQQLKTSQGLIQCVGSESSWRQNQLKKTDTRSSNQTRTSLGFVVL